MPEGLPLPTSSLRQMFGCGVRAGMYPLSDTTAYWYACFNAPRVRRGSGLIVNTFSYGVSAVDGLGCPTCC
jgi:hypothetical protein